VESRIKLLGHPIHPMLIVLPLGLLSAATIFDVLYVLTGNVELTTFSYWALVAGLVGGLLAAVFGLLDWLAIPSDTRAKRVGAWHGGGNLVVVGLFVAAWYLRSTTTDRLPDGLPLGLELAGVGIALFTAWLGGELVYRLGVGVDTDANLDATSSLEREGVVEVKA
jgi:uncharacterized membrane protein